MRKDKSFRKLKRIELVELIYQLRKDNLALEEECRRLAEQLEAARHSAVDEGAVFRLEQMVAELYEATFPERMIPDGYEVEEAPCTDTGDEANSQR